MEDDNPNLSYNNIHHSHEDAASAAAVAAAMEMEMEIQQHYNLLDNSHFNIPQLTHHQELSFDHHSNLDAAADHPPQSFNIIMPSSSSPDQEAAYNSSSTTPDLLNLFHLPRSCSNNFLPNSSFTFDNNLPASSVLYDPLFHLNQLPPAQPPVFRELLQSLPNAYTFPSEHDNGFLEFSRDISLAAGRGKGRDKTGKTTKHFATERERRVHVHGKYQALRAMVPSPTKKDRASIVGDAIEYIKELLRTVRELKLLVEKKRCGSKRLKFEDAASTASDVGDVVECKPLGDPDQCYSTSLRSSWLQRKSKDSEVDVRVIDDEVVIKLVQRKKINLLLFVSRLLDELQLDLHHVAGGNIGDYYSFLFNTKIYEGSSVYASAIANKLIDVLDKHYAAACSTD